MRVLVIGGSSVSTPALLHNLSTFASYATVEVILAGRREKRLEAVTRAAQLLTRNTPQLVIRSVSLDSELCDEEMSCADLILVQVRVGGFDARIADGALADRFGTPGDQEIGPAAVSAAWRTWPFLKRLLSRITLATSRAVVLILTSPVGLLVRLASIEFPTLTTFGICEAPWTTIIDVCTLLGVSPFSVSFQYLGLSHFSCFTSMSASGRDLIEEYFATSRIDTREMKLFWGIPTAPTLHCIRSIEGHSDRRWKHRGLHLKEFAREAFGIYLTGDTRQIDACLGARQTPWYSLAIAPFVRGMLGLPVDHPVFLSAPASRPELDAWGIVEKPYYFREGTLKTTDSSLPKNLRPILAALMAFERSASQAILDANIDRLATAIEGHPWFTVKNDTRTLAQEIQRTAATAWQASHD